MNVRYRLVDFAPAYLPELIDLWLAAWTKAMPAIDFEKRRTWIGDHVAKLHDEGVAIRCALESATDRVAAFITLDRVSGHVDQFAVSPADWGKGVADLLIEEAKRLSAGVLELEVNQDNPRAVRFYERQGFHRRDAGVNPVSGLKTWRYEWRR